MTSSSNRQDVTVKNQGQKQTPSQPDFLIPLDTSWFDRDPETYLQRANFRNTGVTGVDFRRLITKYRETVQQEQKRN